jgi:prepilin-type N-terminal cleavage/methylation domain-containing protein
MCCIKNKRAAFTLVEVLMTLAVGSLVFLVVAALTIYSAKSFASITNYTDLNQTSRMALDKITKEIRRTRGLMSATSNTLVFRLDTPGSNTLTYIYNQTNQTLTQIKSKTSEVLLDDCTYWKHQIFQRTPKSNSFALFPATKAADCKLIQIDWTCTRDRVAASDSESVQSMKIVIRKRVN